MTQVLPWKARPQLVSRLGLDLRPESLMDRYIYYLVNCQESIQIKHDEKNIFLPGKVIP